jgi:hypothetical protein
MENIKTNLTKKRFHVDINVTILMRNQTATDVLNISGK